MAPPGGARRYGGAAGRRWAMALRAMLGEEAARLRSGCGSRQTPLRPRRVRRSHSGAAAAAPELRPASLCDNGGCRPSSSSGCGGCCDTAEEKQHVLGGLGCSHLCYIGVTLKRQPAHSSAPREAAAFIRLASASPQFCSQLGIVDGNGCFTTFHLIPQGWDRTAKPSQHHGFIPLAHTVGAPSKPS